MGFTMPVGVMAKIRQQMGCGWQSIQKRPRTDVVAALACGQRQLASS